MKIKPEQVPSEVVKAMLREWDRGTSVQPDALIAAAINAWPGSYSLAENDSAVIRDFAAIILPLPQKEPRDAE